jgi:DNA repair exonuclease SbcCD nuclease subunit
MDYWALGHIHMPEKVLETPRARYAGCIQGLNPKETGPRGCWVVTMANGIAAEEFVETDAVRWAAPEADISTASDEQTVFVRVCEACDVARVQAEGRPSVVRVKLTGRSAAHGVLLRPGRLEQLLEAAREDQLRGSDWVWIDRIEDASRGALDMDALRGADNFVGELVGIAEGYAADPTRAAALLAAQVDPVVAKFRVDGFEPDPASVVSRALDLCLDGLVGEEE